MILPLFLEQLLVMLVGMTDTLVVSYAGESASQLLLFSAGFSVIISVLVLVCNEWLLRLLFGRVEPDVMAVC